MSIEQYQKKIAGIIDKWKQNSPDKAAYFDDDNALEKIEAEKIELEKRYYAAVKAPWWWKWVSPNLNSPSILLYGLENHDRVLQKIWLALFGAFVMAGVVALPVSFLIGSLIGGSDSDGVKISVMLPIFIPIAIIVFAITFYMPWFVPKKRAQLAKQLEAETSKYQDEMCALDDLIADVEKVNEMRDKIKSGSI